MDSPRYCKNCGHSINPEVKFCKICGTAIGLDNTLGNRLSRWFSARRKWVALSAITIAILLVIITLNSLSTTDLPRSSTKSGDFNPASSVVNILCTAINGSESSGGSGTIMTADGLILTNSHIIPQVGEMPRVQDDKCLVVLPDEVTGEPIEIYYAEPQITKGLSKQYDIATLQIDSVYVDEDGKSWGTYPRTFPEFQDGSNCEGYIKLGDSVRIYGYPVTSGGYNLTITDGIVSSFNSNGTVLTSAKIDSGNSGGLAIDQYGCFIGIPSAIIEGNYQNLGVLIPPNLINDFIDEVPAQTDNFFSNCSSSECYFMGQCIARPANSSCVVDSSRDAWKCNAGYVESDNYCVIPTPTPVFIEKSASELCQDKYGWNTYSDGTYCQCNSSYVWNNQQTACITRTAGCQEEWPNSYWDGTFNTNGGSNCSCISDYVWNTTTTACVARSYVDQICRDKFGYSSYYLGYVEDGAYICK